MDLLIFDFDGLILDTESVSYRSWTEIFASHGAELPLSEWSKCIGTHHGAFDVHAYLEERSGKSLDRREIRRRQHERALELLGPMEPRPGVLDYLREAQALRIALAVASSSHQEWLMGHLARLNLSHCFHSIRCANDVTNVKPHPELYELTLEFMGVAPHRALAFEDSPNGIKAAKAAGIYTVAVPNPVTASLELSEADDRIESMADIRLRDLLERVESRMRERS
jgi:HAD superfamily hydrolase (TIGR01509 family)